MEPKSLAFILEGQGDVESVPGLVHRFLERHDGLSVLRLGKHPQRGGDIRSLINRKNEDEFINRLKRAKLDKNLGAVLLLLDGDIKQKTRIQTSQGEMEFCPASIATFLAGRAGEVGAGKTFSFAAVFACQEFESWILAGHPDFSEQMAGKDVETAPRDAKGKIIELSKKSYIPTSDQRKLTRDVDIDFLLRRNPKVRSFLRLENALKQIVEAVRTGRHISTPR